MIKTFIGFKITFSNIRSHSAPLLISWGWHLAPPQVFVAISDLGFKRVKDYQGEEGEDNDKKYPKKGVEPAKKNILTYTS